MSHYQPIPMPEQRRAHCYCLYKSKKQTHLHGRVKVHLRTSHEGPEGEKGYSSTLSLTSALDGDGWSTPHPGRFTPRKDPVPIEVWVGRRPGLDRCRKSCHLTGIRSQDCPAHSKSLYQLRYPDPAL
jgi:hypothetical protein